MSLKPKYKYSRQILFEMYAAMVAKMAEIIGVETAMGIMSRAAGPVGFENALRTVESLRIKGRNAATVEYIGRIAGDFHGVEMRASKITPGFVETRSSKCQHSDIITRYKHPLVCGTCSEYINGICRFIDENIEFEWIERMPDGANNCTGIYKVEEPKDTVMPDRIITKFLTAVGTPVADKNEIIARSFMTWIVSLGRLMIEIVGPDAAAIPARAAEQAGRYNGAEFISELELKDSLDDAARLVKEVRETITPLEFSTNAIRIILSRLIERISETVAPPVKIRMKDGEAELIIKRCQLASKCMEESESKFIEIACTSYTRGLVSALGSYEIEKVSGTCKPGEECRMMLRAIG